MNKISLKFSIDTCLSNGDRLLADALFLEFLEPPASAYALAIISQEEFAKAFLLALVYKELISWNKYIWRASRDHTCKQLLVMIMDYINPDDDEWDKLMQKIVDGEILDRKLPPHVADAINILRHEKISKWESRSWVWLETPEYDSLAKQTSEGLVDRRKQDQLYTDLSKDGSVITKAQITADQFYIERDRAERLARVVKSLIEDDARPYYRYQKIADSFDHIFKTIGKDNKPEF